MMNLQSCFTKFSGHYQTLLNITLKKGILGSANLTTQLIIIQKISNQETISDYRLICLFYGLMKIIAKVLEMRLGQNIGDIIGNYLALFPQDLFSTGRLLHRSNSPLQAKQ